MSMYVWFALAIVAAVVVTSWVTFTATRLDRLHARVDAARAALDAQLVRRAAAVQHVADSGQAVLGPATSQRLLRVAHAALGDVTAGEREAVENDVGKAANELADRAADFKADPNSDSIAEFGPALREVAESANRVVIARRFYNDAVRDTRTLRSGRMPRLLRLAGHRELPQFFDIDDSSRWSLGTQLAGGG